MTTQVGVGVVTNALPLAAETVPEFSDHPGSKPAIIVVNGPWSCWSTPFRCIRRDSKYYHHQIKCYKEFPALALPGKGVTGCIQAPD